jgi:hypothetical protein
MCKNCHGPKGEGGFGPDLAGRKLTASQFRVAVRKPWGVMPAYVESQISDRELADFVAYFDSLPSVEQPGPWRFELPAGAPRGQEVLLATFGCGQCHGPVFNTPRARIGGTGADVAWLKRMVYDHTGAMVEESKASGTAPPPRLRMGSYAKSRLPESLLQDIWSWASDLGFRPLITTRLGAPSQGANGVSYSLDVENGGVPGKGLTAEQLTVLLQLPAGVSVVGTTGAGYVGVRRDEALKAQVAEWKLSKLAPKEHQTFTLTLSRAGTAADDVRGAVLWAKPAVKTGPSDSANIAPAAPATTPAAR